ncbi:ABC transporter ATP-binding protein [Shewanella sp. GXUN23E]|uniref:ABC transporter ATP-binding protein n=1 Tax=Shewanella sp. GXUN23E TaxID=3422498 RepID=UPI003D7E818D
MQSSENLEQSDLTGIKTPQRLYKLWRQIRQFRHSKFALLLVWQTSKPLLVLLTIASLIAGLAPVGMAWIGQLLVDEIVQQHQSGGHWQGAAMYLALEGGLFCLMLAAQRGISFSGELLKAQLTQHVLQQVLAKSTRLSVAQLEDAEFYNKLNRIRTEAFERPVQLVLRLFQYLQHLVSLLGLAGVMWQFSPWLILLLICGAVPGFIAETWFSGSAFRLFNWQSPDTRRQSYLETVLTRDDHVREVRLFQLGSLMAKQHQAIFEKLYGADRALTTKRESWGVVLGWLGALLFYGSYLWVILQTIRGELTLGQLTMFVMLFRQGQASLTAMLLTLSGLYEDNLYISTLVDFFDTPEPGMEGHLEQGASPGSGIEFINVSFCYPGQQKYSLKQVSFTLKPGKTLALVGENGAGKSTLIKLLTRFYQPESGQILLDGTPLHDWQQEALYRRLGVIFQDFNRYQLPIFDNIGLGDPMVWSLAAMTEPDTEQQKRVQQAAKDGLANDFIQRLPGKYQTQLGRMFEDGVELSGGQWQKIALSRAFMRESADILVLDEPTAAMDSVAEAELFDYLRSTVENKMLVLISHRFSTVRHADLILVIEEGEIIEKGDHQQLIELQGHYSRMFQLQAQAYQ